MVVNAAAWIGRVLASSYQIEQMLGQGGMGAVFRARQLRTGGLVAIKVLLEDADVDLKHRFEHEARTLSKLRHPGIVQIHDFHKSEDGASFIVMELLDGEDLHQHLRRRGQLTIPEVRMLARQVGTALERAHQHGVIHRDIKPQNLFVLTPAGQAEDAATLHFKIVDFGIAQLSDATRLTRSGMLLGTPYYMAPEIIAGRSAHADGYADQFSLAVVLYEALTGQLPFPGPNQAAVFHQIANLSHPPLLSHLPTVPSSMSHAIDRALAKSPTDRFPSIAAFLAAFTQNTSKRVPRDQRRLRGSALLSIPLATLLGLASPLSRGPEPVQPAPSREPPSKLEESSQARKASPPPLRSPVAQPQAPRLRQRAMSSDPFSALLQQPRRPPTPEPRRPAKQPQPEDPFHGLFIP